MRVPVMSVLFVAALAGLSAPFRQSPFVGRWNITGTGADKNKIYFLDVKQNGSELSGIFLDRVAHATPVAWIKTDGRELSWQYGPGETAPKPACGPIYRAHLESDKLVGSHTTPGDPCPRPGGEERAGALAGNPAAGERGAASPRSDVAGAPRAAAPPAPYTINWIGVRQPVWPPSDANAPHTYGQSVVIIGPGIGKEVWTGVTPDSWQTPCEDRWTMADGVMKNEVGAQGQRPTCNIYTKGKFRDFKADAEFNLDAGQNSGFYIRGRYELQLMLGDNPNSPYPGELMDIYGWKRADVYAGNPPGQWQALSVIVVGNHVTATLNGQRVHDNAVLPAFTGGALDNDELAPGPIMIQGDHSRVTFRSLVVTPITK